MVLYLVDLVPSLSIEVCRPCCNENNSRLMKQSLQYKILNNDFQETFEHLTMLDDIFLNGQFDNFEANWNFQFEEKKIFKSTVPVGDSG